MRYRATSLTMKQIEIIYMTTLNLKKFPTDVNMEGLYKFVCAIEDALKRKQEEY